MIAYLHKYNEVENQTIFTAPKSDDRKKRISLN